MRCVLSFVLMLAIACSSSAPAATTRTLPDPVVFSALPERPDAVAIAPEEDWVVPVEDYEVADGDVRSGVLMSDAKAMRAARLRIGYDELRGLYEIDLRTWQRERAVYERYLQLSDEEIARQRELAERTWWEENGDEVGLFTGAILGVTMCVSIFAAVK